jgi:outer membrane receptor for ferrienterochelin and colicin
MSFNKTATPIFSLAFSLAISLPSLAQENSGEIVELDAIKVQHKEESVSEVTLDKLLKVPGAGNDPLQAIASLPGVTFAGGDTSAPAVRGSSPADNRYLIDFMPVGYIFHTDSSSILNDNSLKDFMLDSAAFASQYHDATGAVIAANTRDPYLDQSQTIIDLSVLKASLFVERQIDEKQAFYLSARQSLFQYYIENFLDDEDFKLTTVPEYYDYQGKYQYNISDQEKVSFNILGARDKVGILFDEDSDEVKQDPGLSGGADFSAYFDSQGIVWEKYDDEGNSRVTSLSRLSQIFDFSVGSNIDLDINTVDYSLRSQWASTINLQHEILWGLDYTLKQIAFDGVFKGIPCDEFRVDCRLVDGTETITEKDTISINNYDVNLADNWAVTHLWTLTPGIAIAHDDYTQQTYVEPKVQSRYDFADDWTFTSAYGDYHKLPDDFSSYTKESGNRDLKQTEATHYELGLENQFNESWFWKLETYYKMMGKLVVSRPSYDNYPALTPEQYEALPRYTNDADGEAWGLEFFANKTLSDNWYGWLSVAYSETKRKNNLTGEKFKYNYDQPWIVNLVSSYQITPIWQLGFKWRYQSGQLITPLITANQNVEDPELYDPVYGTLNSERLPASHSLDIRADRTFHYPTWEMDLYVEVLNVYNQRNVTGYSYSEADYSVKEKEVGLPMMPTVGIKAKF